MVSSVVNGYFCASSCDVAKAKKGENPHPSTDPSKVNSRGDHKVPEAPDETTSRSEQPAVVLDGALSALTQIDRVAAANTSQVTEAANRNRGYAIDILA